MPQAVAGIIVAALGGAAALGSIGVALVNIGVGLAFSAVGQLLKGKSKGQKQPGIRSKYTGQGDTSPQTMILGRDATGGHMIAPMYAHSRAPSTLGDTDFGDIGSGDYATFIINLSDVQIEGLNAVYVDGVRFQLDTHLTGTVHPHYGLSVTPSVDRDEWIGRLWVKVYDGTQGAADPYLLAAYGSHPDRPWKTTSWHRGGAYAILTVKRDDKLFRGIPQFRFEVDGLPLYDPETETTAFTNNPAVMVWNIMRGITLPDGLTFGMGVAEADLPSAWWAAAMDVCDATVENSDGGNEAQYRAGIEIAIATPDDGGMDPLTAIDELLPAMSAQVADLGGMWIIRAGAPGMSALSVTDADILNSREQSYKPFRGLADTHNAVAATFPNPDAKWEPTEAPTRFDTAAAAEDGETLIAALDLNTVPYGDQVQRLMRAWLLDAQRRRAHTVALPSYADQITVLDTLDLTSAVHSYSSKLFEVQQYSVSLTTGVVSVAMRETDPDDFIVDPEEYQPLDVVNITRRIAPPLALLAFDAVAHQITDGTGDRKAAIRLTWTVPSDNLDGVAWQVYRGGELVIEGATANAASGEVILSENVLPATGYSARAKPLAQSQETAWSDYESLTTDDIRLGAADIADDALTLTQMASDVTDAIADAAASAEADVAAAEAAAAEAAADALAAADEALNSAASAAASEAYKDAAAAAQAASELAQGLSEDAQSASETASAASVTAKGLSEAAQASAEAAKTQAQTAQGATEAARDLALSYSTSASSSATVAASSATTALMVEGNPGFDSGYEGWSPSYAATATTLSATQGDIGTYLGRTAFKTDPAVYVAVGQKKLHLLTPGRKYRARGSFAITGGGSAAQMYLGAICVEADNTPVGSNSGLHYNIAVGGYYAADDDWHDLSSAVFTLADLQAVKGSAVDGIRLIGLLNYNNAAGSAVVLDGIWLEDVTESENASDYADASATSASAAGVSATDAGVEAAAATTARVAAETAQGASEAAETGALAAQSSAEAAQGASATSATNAATSASQSATYATNSANSATASGTSASAAASSATLASTKASEASTSASASEASRVAAETAEGNAATYASNSATSATSAAGSASSASASEGVVATATAQVIKLTDDPFFALPESANPWSMSAAPENTATNGNWGGANLYLEAGTDDEVGGQDIVGKGPQYLYSKRYWAIDPSRKYRMRVRAKRDAHSSGNAYLYAGFANLNASWGGTNPDDGYNGNAYAAASGINVSLMPVDGEFHEFTSGIITGTGSGNGTFRATTKYIRLCLLLNFNEADNGNITRVSCLELIDVTEVEAAAGSASAAATSEANAAASETASASSASASNSSKIAAETARTGAEAAETNAASSAAAALVSETNSATSETNAAGSASTATTQAGIATSAAGTATTKAGEASTSATNAATSASSAASSATSASGSASTATTQAGIATSAAGTATTKAGEASTSAASAATQASNAASSATGAAGSASTATTQAGIATSAANTATTKAGEASTSATSAATSASNAASSASASAASASASSSSAVVAEAARDDAEDAQAAAATSAGAAASSASSAAASDTSAGSEATASQAARTAAETAQAAAEAAEASAATSETNAAGSAASAATQAGLSTTAKNAALAAQTAAETAQSAAASSATSAAGSASTATTQASLATTAKNAAETAQSAASTSAASAATSASNAAGSASTATTQATLSANSAAAADTAMDTAVLVEGNPGFESGFEGWLSGWTPSSGLLSTSQGTIGTVRDRLAFKTNAGARYNPGQRKYHRVETGRKYRIRSAYTSIGGSAKFYIGISVVDADGDPYGSNSGLIYNVASAVTQSDDGLWHDVTSSVFDLAYLVSQKGAAAYGVRLIAFLNFDNASGVQGAIPGIWLEDVTESEAAATSAAASATSASTATTKASEASSSATAATTAKVAAEAAQAASASSASAASSSSSVAAAEASDAAASAVAADTAKVAAETASGSASTSATSAATSATTAGGHATNAATYSTSALASLNEVKGLVGNFDFRNVFENWTLQGGSKADVSSTAEFSAGRAIRLTGSSQFIYDLKIPVSRDRIYRVRARVRNIGSAAGPVYFGVATYDGSGTLETAAPGSHRYCAAAGTSVPNDSVWREFSGEITGGGASHSQFRTTTAFAAPFGLTSYSVGGGIFDVDYLIFEDITEARAEATIVAGAVADIETGLAASIGFRAKAGTAGAELDLVALDDATGNPVSAARISADDILLDGTVRAHHLVIDDKLELSAASASFVMGKQSPSDTADGIFLGRPGVTDDFAIYAGLTDSGTERSVRITKDEFTIRNALFRIGAGAGSSVNVTTSQTIDLTGDTLTLDFAGAGGGGAGASATANNTGTAGSAGGDTVVVLKDGTTTIETWTASGGAAGAGSRADTPHAEGTNPSIYSPYANGGRGGKGYGIGTEGADGFGGKAGQAGAAVTVSEYDISGLSDPKIVITIGAAGAKYASVDTNQANGDAGFLRYADYSDSTVPGYVVASKATASGTITMTSGVAGSFPTLTPTRGVWLLYATLPANIEIDVGDGGAAITEADRSPMTFISDATPSWSDTLTESRTVKYKFWPVG